MTDMPSKVDVAIAQIEVRSLSPEENRKKLEETAAEVAAAHGPDLILFPELANTGYVIDRDREFGEQYLRLAETIPGPTTAAVGRVAAARQVHVIVGLAEAHPTIPATIYDSAALIGPSGEVVGVQRKLHIPGQEKHYFARGARPRLFDTELGRIGITICYDAFFPELARVLALGGAHFICCPFNTAARFDHPDTMRAIAQTRAIENKLFVATCNRVGQDHGLQFYGRSAAADPYGNVLAEAGEDEEILMVTFDGAELWRERAYHPVFVDRRPELYGSLTEGADEGTSR